MIPKNYSGGLSEITSNMVVVQTIRILILMAVSFLLALAVTPLWLRVIQKHALGKQIRSAKEAPIFQRFHQKKTGTPTTGGVIIWGTVLTVALFLQIMAALFGGLWLKLSFIDRSETYLPLTAFLVAALLGLLDDILGIMRIGVNGGGLKIRYKLVSYALLGAVGAWWFYFKLGRRELVIPLLGMIQTGLSPLDIGWWYIPLFIFIIVATAFSANETDGLDGLLGGVALFTFGALTTVAFVGHLYQLAAFGGVMIGSLLAFLWYNIYPARFFMGDTGSMSLGITIGVVAMLTNTVLLLPLFAFIPLLESLSVIVQLVSKKFRHRKIFLSTPIHHHFEGLGWPESQVTMRFWIISAIGCALGLVIFFLDKFSLF